MFGNQLDGLLREWKRLFGQYEKLKTEAENAASRWEWTTGERYNPLPFYFFRFPGRGRVLQGTPASIGYYLLYGFDQQGQVRLRQSWKNESSAGADLSKTLYRETFYRYAGDRIDIIQFSTPPRRPIPLSLQQIFFENGRVLFSDSFELNGYTPLYSEKGKNPDDLYEWLGNNGRFKTGEAYRYEENRLQVITGYYEAPGLPPYSAEERFHYDEAGKLVRIDRIYADGQNQVIYRKRPKGQTFRAIREEATTKLARAIAERIRAAKIKGKVYCIELNYLKASQHFPPCIVVTPESYRLALAQSTDPDDRINIFCPIFEREWFYQIEDPEILEMCQVLEQEIRSGEKWDTATGILRDVAAVLTRYDWGDILDVTPDFVVFALDPELEGSQLVEVLSASVPQTQIQEWVDKGWL